MNYSKQLHKLIPGGAHTYSRGDDQFPGNAPQILEKGNGAYVWDPDGNKFLDFGMGLRSVNIGYGNQEVAEAVYQEALHGNNLTRASLTELNAAQLLVDLIPAVEMVKFAKHGSTVTTAAMKLARAYTNRKYIAVPAQHPFFSFDDWFIGTTVMQKGVPEEVKSLTLKFDYNDIDSLKQLFDQYPGQIAAVMLEPATTTGPCPASCDHDQQMSCHGCENNGANFLHQVKKLCVDHDTVFILDEMITGFRWHLNGAQSFYNVEPDLCTFGKGMANGFAVAALGGKREIMNLGGILDEGQERLFLTSTTHGAEMSGLGAFIKTIEILKRDHVVDHFWDFGQRLMDNFNDLAAHKGISEHIYMVGYPCSPNYLTKDKEGNMSLEMRTLFAEKMLDEKVMMPYIAISASHGDEELNITMEAVGKSMDIYAKALNDSPQKFLNSSVIKPVFRKYN